ncbi:uncharacterized protein RB166_015358 [Leptodactylus fuscus]|uniref:uncharacterized protein LOC142216759 n=1 Tax=Leptodactylus fuscus TaxID=238119 RepID=UPI003F4E597C
MDLKALTRYIKNFSFDQCPAGRRGYRRILLQLFGFLGHGKSSFINSCKYVLEDTDYVNYAGANMSDEGRTTARISYKLTESLTLVDNRGCGKMDSYETGEIFAQLANLLPLDVPVEWSRGFRLVDRIVDAETTVRSSDFVFPLFLYSIKKRIPSNEVEDLKKLLQNAERLTGIFPFVVLTYKTFGNLTETEEIFRKMGVERIFALENYTTEDHHRTRGRHEAVLTLLYEVIREVEFLLRQPRNPIQEVKDRKQFILRFIWEREMKSLKTEQESRRVKENLKLGKDQYREEDRRQFDEEMNRLVERLEFQRQSDRQKLEAEIKQYKMMVEKLNKKPQCVIQ